MAGLAVVAAVLAGCSEPEQPSTTLPTATSTSAAQAPLEPLGPADFPVPDEAREQTEAGAIAMAMYYLDLIDHVKDQMVSGTVDSAALRDLENECEVCEQIAAGFDAEVAAGNHYEGADLTLQPGVTATVTGLSADVVFIVEQAPATSIGPDQSVIRTTDVTTLRGGMVFEWSEVRNGWIASQLNLVAS